MSFTSFTKNDYDQITREFASLEEMARHRCANDDEFTMVQKAFAFANEAHKNIRRCSGEPYIIHPIAVAKIVVSEIGLGYKSICAALLHDVFEDSYYSADDIRNLFGDKIASLVDGMNRIKTVLDNENRDHALSPESTQSDNFKKVLLTLNDDARVVLIKLADRLHNIRTIDYIPDYKRSQVLYETMFIFIPLAHRLGLYEIKSEMENTWLRFSEPDAYNEIALTVSQNVENRESEVNEFIEPVRKALEDSGFDFEIKKRVKSPYSIWRKMQNKGVTLEEVFDLYAIRIIFNCNSDSHETERAMCYHIFSIVTGMYKYRPDRVRDWISQPKSNGYEALHCTLMCNSGFWIEVQIRSRRMDDIAEKGIAAHWAYKKEGYISEEDSQMDKWLVKVKDVLGQKGDVDSLELLDVLHDNMSKNDIVVFTPKGQQIRIQNGCTALDFAYQIHSQIGDKAIAAKVNMKLVPLSAVLKTGDQVEIISAETGKPKKEWLQFLRSRRAINRVMDYFRTESISDSPEGLNRNRISIRGRMVKGIIGKINTILSQYPQIEICRMILEDDAEVLDGLLEMEYSDEKAFRQLMNKLSAIDGITDVKKTDK